MCAPPDAATHGFDDAVSYDAYRPSYPPEAVDCLIQQLQLGGLKGARIVDLAAGTGKFTELLARREERFEVIAVEPHDEMRAILQNKGLEGVKVKVGNATNMPLKSQSVDAIIIAQAFHWFANEEALHEIHRVLVPGGVLGLIWNIEDYNAPRSWLPTTQWERSLKTITWSSGNDSPRLRHEQWKDVFEKQVESSPFSIQSADPLFSLPLGETVFKFTHWLCRETIWKRYRTLSQFAVLEGQQLAKLEKEVLEVISGPDVETNEIGEVGLHGRTVLQWTTSIPGTPLR